MKRYFLALLFFTLFISSNTAHAASLLINEVDADTLGTDTAEFIELYDGGTGSTLLDNLVVVLYNGSNDTVYNSFDLSGYATDSEGYFVIGGSDVSAADITLGSNILQNGADAVALYAGSGSDFPDGTAVTTANIIDAFVYDTNDADDPGLLVLLNPGQLQFNENGDSSATSVSSQRYPNGAGGARNTDAFYLAAPTPGYSNGGMATVPLPSSMALLFSGLAGLVSINRRRKGN